MGFEVTDDNILSLPLEVLCFLQHAERLADSSRIAQKHFSAVPGRSARDLAFHRR